MYTIIMNEDKSLTATHKTTIYQREKLVDKIQFLFPQTYGDLNLSECSVILKYLDQANISHAEILQRDNKLYKNHLRYILPVDTNLTRFSGNVEIRVTFSKVDMESQQQYVLHSGPLTITINPLKDYYAFVPDESLEFVDQLVGNLEAKLEAADKISETYDAEKADNITYDENKLQLTSNGKKIGNSVTILSGGESGSGADQFEVVEF